MNSERKLIHDIRNCLNMMKLGCTCLPLFSRAEVIHSMEAIGLSADELVRLLRELEQVRGHEGDAGEISTHGEKDAGYDSHQTR